MSNTAVFLMTEEQLDAIIDRRCLKLIAEKSAAVPKEYLTLTEVCQLWQLSRKTVAKYIREDGFPHTPVGNRVNRFVRADVAAWFKAREEKR